MSNYRIQGATGEWEVVIGLEVHAQVTSNSKLFSGAATAFGAEPNSQVSLVDAAMPGMLPVPNAECIRQAVRTGMAIDSDRGLPGPSFDVSIGDVIGTRTRFRSIELSATGDPRNSLSGRGGGNLNPSEVSAAALYQRIFGLGFKDPNSASFTPGILRRHSSR